jgi:polyhydroxyalkanoate synthase
MLRGVDAIEGVDPKQKEQIRFAAQGFIDAMSPTNFPRPIRRCIDKIARDARREPAQGPQHMLADLRRGQLTHTDARPSRWAQHRRHAGQGGEADPALPVDPVRPHHREGGGRSAADLPAVDQPLLHPRPRPKKSFVKWAVDQGLSVFMVSWKSADASMADVTWDDYVAARSRRSTRCASGCRSIGPHHRLLRGGHHAGGHARLARRAGQADKVASATFFTAQVDFSKAGELLHFVDDEQLR